MVAPESLKGGSANRVRFAHARSRRMALVPLFLLGPSGKEKTLQPGGGRAAERPHHRSPTGAAVEGAQGKVPTQREVPTLGTLRLVASLRPLSSAPTATFSVSTLQPRCSTCATAQSDFQERETKKG